MEIRSDSNGIGVEVDERKTCSRTESEHGGGVSSEDCTSQEEGEVMGMPRYLPCEL